MTTTLPIRLSFHKAPRNAKGEFNGIYTVIDANGRALCSARTPLLSAARVLLHEGHDPTSTIFMTRHGETAWSLKASLGVAARFTVRESETAGPALVAYDAAALAKLKVEASPASE